MRKLVASTVAAAGLVVGFAGPAAATVVSDGRAWTATCNTTTCIFYLKTGAGTVATFPDRSGYIFDCGSEGVPNGSSITQARLNTLKANAAYVYVVYDQPAGYRDAVTCE